MKSEQISKITPGLNQVLIKPFISAAGKISMGSMDLILDTSFEKEKNAATTGMVVKSCESIYFNRKDGEKSSEYKTTVEIEPGDTVYFHYLSVEECDSQGKLFQDESGEHYMMVPYERLFCAKRDGEIIMLNGWLLMEPVVNPNEVNTGGLELPDYLKDKHSLSLARVHKKGAPLTAYLKEYDNLDESNIIVDEGDLVFYSKNSDIRLQSELQTDLDGDKTFFRMQRKDLIAITDDALIQTK